MATNFYFQSGNTSGTTNEQRLLENLIIESITIYGHDIYYIPRVSVKQDDILGEDILSRFENAYPIEMYLTNIQGWEGNGDLFTKFGINLTDQATFAVSRRRWEESIASQPPELFQLPERPAEGDLLYFPKTRTFFEIKYVQHLDPFYQLGKFYLYSMQCEIYVYSSENFDTGIPEIDKMETNRTQDILSYELNGDPFSEKKNSPLSDNEQFAEEASDILDFSIGNPFGEY